MIIDCVARNGYTICAGLTLAYLNPQAVLVDMEEGVVNEILQGPLREMFDSTQLLTDVSGSGNNWCETDEQRGISRGWRQLLPAIILPCFRII